jgi:hypothetical protein
MNVDASKWSGEGAFTQIVIECLRQIDAIALLRIEDAPASRSEADYNFVSNEIYVAFAVTSRHERTLRFGFLPASKTVVEPAMTIEGLEGVLTAASDIGPPDYSDEGMLQYLRTERIVPPYQTRGYKLVELVRVYDAGAARRS